MTNLMALIDGSKYSQSVCDHAAWIAGNTEGAVELIHVLGRREVSSETENLSGNIGLGARTALLDELVEQDAQKARQARERGRLILEAAKQRLIAAGVKNVKTKLRLGDIVEAVEDLEEDVDMIVIGKRGDAADFDKLHLGSNLEPVARSSHRPVLVASRAFKPIERFLVVFDDSLSVKKAISHIVNNKAFLNLKCELLMVGVETPKLISQLESAAVLLREVGYDVLTKTVDGQPEAVITREVESDHYDLLVMGGFRHSRFRNLITGSTTSVMIRSCKIPVLLFR